jgi:uncharacterized protein YjbI with pentapeptide repeats
MAIAEHEQLLRNGLDALRSWRAANTEEVLDLSGARLSGLRLEGAPLERANFRGAVLSNCLLRMANLTGADLVGANLDSTDLSEAVLSDADLSAILQSARLERTDLTKAMCQSANFTRVDIRTVKYDRAIFHRAVFIGASLPRELLQTTDCTAANFQETDLSGVNLADRDFSSCDFSHANLAEACFRATALRSAKFDGCDLQRADMTGADCTAAIFISANLSNACLRNTNLRGSNFSIANMCGADISHADFYEASLADARMEHLRGAPAARNLLTTRIERPVHYFESAVLSPVDRWLDWETVRIAGRLPLFGASYSALIAIPLFFYGLKIYNDKIALLRHWAEQTRSGTADYQMAQTVLDQLHPLPVPALSALLLLSTMCLAIGSTIYALACPSRVKEFSRDQWKYQLGLSIVHYLADAWRGRVWRVAAFVFYFIGGAGAAIVLVSKLVNVARFLLGNQAWSF